MMDCCSLRSRHPAVRRRVTSASSAAGALFASLSLALLTLPVTARAQDDAAAQNPQPQKTLRIDLGRLWNQKKGGEDKLYYRLSYDGRLLRQKGTPITVGDLTTVEPPDPVNPGGDLPDLVLRLQNGGVSGLGPLADAIKMEPLRLRGPLRHLRGAAQFTGQLNGQQLNLAVGVETAPYHPVSEVFRLRVPNYLVFGLQGEAQSRRRDREEGAGGPSAAMAGGGDTGDVTRDVALVTYRTGLSFGGGWVASKDLLKRRDELAPAIVAKYGTYNEANKYKEKLDKKNESDLLTHFESIVRGLLELKYDDYSTGKRDDPTVWKRDVEAAVKAYTVPDDRPTYTAELESAGWYTLSGRSGPRGFNAAVTATGTFYLDPRNDDTTFLRVLYQNGYLRSAPDVRQDFVALTFGYSFR